MQGARQSCEFIEGGPELSCEFIEEGPELSCECTVGGPELVPASTPAAYGLLDPVQVAANVGVDTGSLGPPTGV